MVAVRLLYSGILFPLMRCQSPKQLLSIFCFEAVLFLATVPFCVIVVTFVVNPYFVETA